MGVYGVLLLAGGKILGGGVREWENILVGWVRWGGVEWGWVHCLIMPNTKQMTRVRNIRIKIWK